jgi:hypothetical protein
MDTPAPVPAAALAAVCSLVWSTLSRVRQLGALGRRCAVLACFGLALVGGNTARATESPGMSGFELIQDDEGITLSYAVDFQLTRSVEDALNKGVPLYFLAEAEVYQSRWYWRDKRVSHATRLWRVVYQPLTSSYRVTFGGLTQNYNSPAEALAAMRRGVRWRIAEAGQIDAGKSHYVEFSLRLDTTLLPRPMQIGISGQPDWSLSVERTQRVN